MEGGSPGGLGRFSLERFQHPAGSVEGGFPWELTENLRSLNPWWRQREDIGPPPPPFRRWPFGRLRRLLHDGLAPATVLRGPRRVGKTVLLRQIMESHLTDGIDPRRILYVPFDELPSLGDIREPVLAIARWYEKQILGAASI